MLLTFLLISIWENAE